MINVKVNNLLWLCLSSMDFPKLALKLFISEYGCVFPVQSCSLFLVLPILISLFIHDCCWCQLWSYCRLLWLLTIDWWSSKANFPVIVIGTVIVPIVRLVGYLTTTTFRFVYLIAHNYNCQCLYYLINISYVSTTINYRNRFCFVTVQ